MNLPEMGYMVYIQTVLFVGYKKKNECFPILDKYCTTLNLQISRLYF